MNKINLLPGYYVKQRLRNRVDLACIVLFVVVLVSIFLGDFFAGRSHARTREQYEAVLQRTDNEAKFMREFFDLQARERKLRKTADQAVDMEERIPRSYLLAVCASVLPHDLSLTELEIRMRPQKVLPSEKNKLGQLSKPKKRIKSTTTAGPAQSGPIGVPMPPEEEKIPPQDIGIELTGISDTDTAVAELLTRLKGLAVVKSAKLRYVREFEVDEKTLRQFHVGVDIDGKTDVRNILHPKPAAFTGPQPQPGDAS